jgi:hypothetical protein
MQYLTGKPERRRSFERPKPRWENSTETDIKEIGYGDVDCIYLAQDMIKWRALLKMQ